MIKTITIEDIESVVGFKIVWSMYAFNVINKKLN
jgi:hypothetical protein